LCMTQHDRDVRAWAQRFSRMEGTMARLHIEAALDEFPGMSPEGSGEEWFSVEANGLAFHLASSGNSSMLSDAWFVPDVCRYPAGVWRGLNRPGQEQALCYAGIPSGQFAFDHNATPFFQTDRTFLVFATPDFRVTKWRWSEADLVIPAYPLDYQTRFGEQLWPNASATDWRNS
jgi:hypothetical protein